jgi:uncharacterized protein (TIGR02996 family)
MSTLPQALLDAVYAAPDEDVPRLACADWLEENGQADRAEMISRHLSESGLPATHTSLLRQWLAPVWPHITSCQVRQGLVYVEMQVRTFLSRAFQEHGADWLRQAGVEGLILIGKGSRFDRLAASPVLQAVRDLELHCQRMKDSGLRDFVSGPPLPSLHTLALRRGRITRSGMEALAGSDRFPRLRRLGLVELRTLGLPGFQALAGWPQLAALRALELRGCRVDAVRLAELFRPGALSGLRRLVLEGDYLTDTGVRALAAAGCLAGLRQLCLNECDVGDAGVAALLEAPFTAGLERLILQGNSDITSAGARLLAGCPGLAGLRILNLLFCGLDAEGLRALLDSPHLRGLRHLLVDHGLLQEGELAERFRSRFRVW